MNDEIQIASDLLKLKMVMRNVQQISYSSKKLEERFTDIEFGTPTEMKKYIKANLAYIKEISNVLKELRRISKHES